MPYLKEKWGEVFIFPETTGGRITKASAFWTHALEPTVPVQLKKENVKK